MNVVYLMGAGASYNAIPVLRGDNDKAGLVDLMKKVIMDFYQKVGPFRIQKLGIDVGAYNYIFEFLEMDGKILLDVISRYRTPDTLARKVYIANGLESKEYRDLKYVLILFFTLWRYVTDEYGKETHFSPETKAKKFDEIDQRYFGLLSNILNNTEGKITWDNRITFLTWNYDSQIDEVLGELTSLNG